MKIHDLRPFEKYRPMMAFPRSGATDCEDERGRYFRLGPGRGRGKVWVDLVCLPDTVDPRGPKGT